MIDYEYADLFLTDSVDKQLHIYFDETGEITNEDLYSQEFTLRESLCSEQQLKFGSCEASSVEFKIANSGISLKGKTINVQTELGGHSELPFVIGTYTIASDKPTADRFGREIVAYDAMYDILNADMLAWWNNLPNTFTPKILRDAFFTYFGIQQETITLDNDSLVINKTEQKSVSGMQIITAICEINGCFGHIGRDNKMHYLFLREVIEGLYPSMDLFPQEDLYPRVERVGSILEKRHYIHAEYEDYMIQKIDKINVYNRQNNLVASSGTGSNVYNITDNILVEGMTNSVAQTMVATVYSTMAGVWYMPCQVECVGTPCIEVGDSVRLNTSDKVIYMYVMERTLKGIQALVDTLESHGDEYRTDDMNSLASQVSRLSAQSAVDSSRINAANTAISGVNSRVNTIEGNYVRVNQLEAVSARVGNLEADHVSVGSLNAVSARVGSLEADHVTVGSFNALTGTVNRINANYVKTSELTANNINAIFNNSSGINANNAKIGTLSASNNFYFKGQVVSSIRAKDASGYTRTFLYLPNA